MNFDTNIRPTVFILGLVTVILLLAAILAPTSRIELSKSIAPLELATTQADSATALKDILSGYIRPGFFPESSGTLSLEPRRGKAIWIRIQTDLNVDDDQIRFIRLERAPIDRLSLYLPEDPEKPVASAQFFRLGSWDSRWPDGFVLRLPDSVTGASSIYLKLEGSLDIRITPQIIDGSTLAKREEGSKRLFMLVYGVIFLGFVLGFLSRASFSIVQSFWLIFALFVSALSFVFLNDHFSSLPAELPFYPASSVTVYSMALLLSSALLGVLRTGAGLDATSPFLAQWYQRLGWGLAALAILGFFVPEQYANWVRAIAEFAWVQVILLGLLASSMDSRRMAWAPIAVLSLLLISLLTRALAAQGIVPAVSLALYSYQLLIALLLLIFAALPWARKRFLPGHFSRAKADKKVVITPEMQWQEVQGRLVAGIQTAIKHGTSGDDIGWMAYRKLIESYRQLIEGNAVAVVLSGFRGQDTVLVDKSEQEARFQRLLAERGRLLKSLAKLHGPQQIAIEFEEDQKETEAQVLVIPLHDKDSSWGLLLIERAAGQMFEAEEIKRCSVLAEATLHALTNAGTAHEKKQQRDLDADLGALHKEALSREVNMSFERCRNQTKPFSVVRIVIEANEDSMPVLDKMQFILNAAREDMAFGGIVGRDGENQLLLALPSQGTPQARAFAQQILLKVDAMLPGALNDDEDKPRWRVGIAGSAVGEISARPMMERLARAIARTRAPGAASVQVELPVS